MRSSSDNTGELGDALLDLCTQRGDLERHVHPSEKPLGIDVTLPQLVGVDVEHMAAADL